MRGGRSPSPVRTTGPATPDVDLAHRQQAPHPRGGRRDDRRRLDDRDRRPLHEQRPDGIRPHARTPQGARPDRRRDRARHADRVARRRRLRPHGRLRARQPRGLRPRTALPRRRPGGRGRDRGVQRAHTDLPAPGRRLPDSRTCRRRPASAPTCSRSTPIRPARSTTPPPASRIVACTPLPVDVAIVHGEAADTRGNVRVDPKLVWMDSELVEGGGDDDRRRSSESSRRRASAPRRTARRIRASPSRPSSRLLGGPIRPPASRATPTTATSSAPTPRRTPTRPRRSRSGTSGSSGPRRTPRSSTRTAARAPCSRSPGGRCERRLHDRRADGDDARAGVHERHLCVQRRRLVRSRLRLPARPAHARARSRLGRELDRDRRRSRRRSPSRRCRTPSGTAPRCSRTRPTTSGPTRRTAATTPSPSAAPRWTRSATSTTRRSGRTSRRRCACPAAAAWQT